MGPALCVAASDGPKVVARDADGEDFAATLRVRKEGSALCGRFSEAPRLRMRLLVSEEGTVLDASGDCHAFIGYKPKSLKGASLSKFVKAEEMATVALDEKTVLNKQSLPFERVNAFFFCAKVVSLRCKNGLSVFASARLTKGEP